MRIYREFLWVKPNLSGASERSNSRGVDKQVASLKPFLVIPFWTVSSSVLNKNEVAAYAGLAKNYLVTMLVVLRGYPS